VGVHRSRYELERVLDRYGATDFALVEADSEAAIQFAMDGRYVQVGLPLPDSNARHFTHTASGRPRAPEAHERAYEQAMREHWRGLLLAVRGKLQSVESGLSTFEDEFANFLMPHFEEKKRNGERKKPRAVSWLLGSSHSVAIALVAAFLVPASAVGAFALPPTVVGQLAAPFRGALPHELGESSDGARALALGQSIWVRDETAPSHLSHTSRTAHHGFTATLPEADEAGLDSSGETAGAEAGGPRQGLEPPESEPSANEDEPAPAPTWQPSASAPAPEPDVDAVPPAGGEDADSQASTDESTLPAEDESSDSAATTAPPDDPPAGDGDTTAEPSAGGHDDGHDNGNHTGADNGNHSGADNGNKNDGNGKHKDH
jgi:hypothetical protein